MRMPGRLNEGLLLSDVVCSLSSNCNRLVLPRGVACPAYRHLFETTARKLVSENPRVEFSYGTTVTGLLFEGNDKGDNGCQGDSAAAAAAGAGRGTADKLGKAVTGGWVLAAGFVLTTGEP